MRFRLAYLALLALLLLTYGCDSGRQAAQIVEAGVTEQFVEPGVTEQYGVQLPFEANLIHEDEWIGDHGDTTQTAYLWSPRSLTEAQVEFEDLVGARGKRIALHAVDDTRLPAQVRQKLPAGGKSPGVVIKVTQTHLMPCPPCFRDSWAPGCSCPDPVEPQGREAVLVAVKESLGESWRVTDLLSKGLEPEQIPPFSFWVVESTKKSAKPVPPRRYVFLYDSRSQEVLYKQPDRVPEVLKALRMHTAPNRLEAEAWLTLAEGVHSGRLAAHWATATPGDESKPHRPLVREDGEGGWIILGWRQVAPPSPEQERLSLHVSADGEVRFERTSRPGAQKP